MALIMRNLGGHKYKRAISGRWSGWHVLRCRVSRCWYQECTPHDTRVSTTGTHGRYVHGLSYRLRTTALPASYTNGIRWSRCTRTKCYLFRFRHVADEIRRRETFGWENADEPTGSWGLLMNRSWSLDPQTHSRCPGWIGRSRILTNAILEQRRNKK